MTKQTEPCVGLQIRALREQQKLSLRALAERSGLSINAISLIERGENSPTVSSLHLLATALRVPITNFFEEKCEKITVFVKRDHRLYSDGHGMRIESLGIGLCNQKIEPFLLTIEPGAGTVNDPITHAGQEFVYCLEGEVVFSVGAESYQMKAGDSLIFEAEQPHCFYNATEKPTTILKVFQTTEGNDTARQRHLQI